MCACTIVGALGATGALGALLPLEPLGKSRHEFVMLGSAYAASKKRGPEEIFLRRFL
jgi:hypothetical protein